ncbi:hypothetical protein [Ruminococcus albus]|uniref:Uncharacterized protein n=1 Tax=Ruminococcus albus TaxID=1264 RepID=A0A1H7IAJ9_RUMAL|nr:hypothetical protein [Ruminococcus albus]SEK58560.1 hypothetical protein SAMN05216469_103279 [Ruminococcus albus]
MALILKTPPTDKHKTEEIGFYLLPDGKVKQYKKVTRSGKDKQYEKDTQDVNVYKVFFVICSILTNVSVFVVLTSIVLNRLTESEVYLLQAFLVVAAAVAALTNIFFIEDKNKDAKLDIKVLWRMLRKIDIMTTFLFTMIVLVGTSILDDMSRDESVILGFMSMIILIFAFFIMGIFIIISIPVRLLLFYLPMLFFTALFRGLTGHGNTAVSEYFGNEIQEQLKVTTDGNRSPQPVKQDMEVVDLDSLFDGVTVKHETTNNKTEE